ncbi:MAG: major capsid protein [Desulforhopalus sp.]
MGELIINPFDDSGYDLATMTTAVNLIPNNYGRVRQLGLFSPEPVRTRTILVENVNGVLTLLQSQPPGAPAPRKKQGKGVMRSFVIPHVPYDDQIKPSDLQGRREPGTVDEKTLEVEMRKRLTEMRSSHAITEEHLMMGAVKGIILDADGSTIYNLYDEFGIAGKSVAFALDVDTTEVTDKCREVVRHIEDNLFGDVMMGVRCLCDETFFDALITHPNVEKFYLSHAKAVELAGGGADPRKGFSFGGIVFEEYRGKATDPADGNMRSFISAGYAHFFPVGTQSTFKLHHAPAEYMETVGTYGMPIYAKQVMQPSGKWVDILTESNPLPLCRRPGALVTGTLA